MVAVLLVDVGFGDLHSTKDPAMDLYIIHMSKLILQSATGKIIIKSIIKKMNLLRKAIGLYNCNCQRCERTVGEEL